MLILGIDPGLATVGIGILEAQSVHDLHCKEWMTITTEPGLPLPVRLREVYEDIGALMDNARPDLVVIEQLFFATNARTAIAVAQARGVLMLAAAERALTVLEPTPLQMKLAITGDGAADKLQVQTMLMHMLRLTELPQPDDAADALALAVYGALQCHHARAS